MKQRLKAFFTHLFISLVGIACVFALTIHYIYPKAIAEATRGLDAFQTLILVDLILGPVLTLIIYNKNKPYKELLSDISIIATLQVCALIYGLAILYQERPSIIIYWSAEEYFQILNQEDFQAQINNKEQFDSFKHKLSPISPYISYYSLRKSYEEDIKHSISNTANKVMGTYNLDTNNLHDISTDFNQAQLQLHHFDKNLYSNDSETCLKRRIRYGSMEGMICYNPNTQTFHSYE